MALSRRGTRLAVEGADLREVVGYRTLREKRVDLGDEARIEARPS